MNQAPAKNMSLMKMTMIMMIPIFRERNSFLTIKMIVMKKSTTRVIIIMKKRYKRLLVFREMTQILLVQLSRKMQFIAKMNKLQSVKNFQQEEQKVSTLHRNTMEVNLSHVM